MISKLRLLIALAAVMFFGLGLRLHVTVFEATTRRRWVDLRNTAANQVDTVRARHSGDVCDFGDPKQTFLGGHVAEGLTNQRLALMSYLALAYNTNRTFIVPCLKTGNFMMGRAYAFPAEHVFDLEHLARHGVTKMCVLPNGTCEVNRAVPGVVTYGRTRNERYTENGAQRTSDRMNRFQPAAYYAKRFDSSARVVWLREDVWMDVDAVNAGTFAAYDDEPPRPPCESHFAGYIAADSALVFNKAIRRRSEEIMRHIRELHPGRTVTWFHLRIEDDWAMARPAGSGECEIVNEKMLTKMLIASINATLLKRTFDSAAPGSELHFPRKVAEMEGVGWFAPTRDTVLYVAGGLKPKSFMTAMRALFADVITADTLSSPAFENRSRDLLPDVMDTLNLMTAAVDFDMALLSDMLIGHGCSTFTMWASFMHAVENQGGKAWLYTPASESDSIRPYNVLGCGGTVPPSERVYRTERKMYARYDILQDHKLKCLKLGECL